MARWSPEEPHYTTAKKVFRAVGDLTVEGWTSVLTTLEASAVAVRQWGQLPEEFRARWSRADVVAENLSRLWRASLRWIQVPGDITLELTQGEIRMPAVFGEAIGLCPEAPLKTLDLLHLAAATYANRVLEANLQRFITLDQDFLRLKGELAGLTGMTFETPMDLVRALNL